ncbi:hypothetical protein ACQPYA_11950 [Micromonospora sp. CA-263727]|uniref:hypothetical protein n=1 Tax=Micromonospora sp. CA-263727 TaxID=3239967 RepID=UPI003D8FCCAC
MDLWDMTKLLFRRWYISLPLLLAVLVLVGVASQVVKPDYSAKAHIQLIPPQVVTGADGRQKPIKNQWFDLGYVALGNAAMIDVTRQSVLKQMVDEGLTDNVTVTMDRVPLFEIEAVGDSPEQATASAERMLTLITEAVAERQTSLRVAESDMITTLALDDGSEVEVQHSKVMRVMVVALGAGLLLTAGVTVAVDALLRRRARRRAGTGATAASPEASAGQPAVARPPAKPFDGEATQVVSAPGRAPSPTAAGAAVPRVVRQPTGSGSGPQPGPRIDAESRRPSPTPPDADATVVLPVSHSANWPRGSRADRQ